MQAEAPEKTKTKINVLIDRDLYWRLQEYAVSQRRRFASVLHDFIREKLDSIESGGQ